MKTYTIGTTLFCDWVFCGKPRAVCVEVLEEGSGTTSSSGKIRAKLLENCKGYNKGDIVTLTAYQAVPVRQELRLREGQITRRIDTGYRWVKQ